MELEEFIKELQELNKKVKQNKEKYDIKCNIESMPITREIEDTSRMEKQTVWEGNNIIYTVIIEERFLN